MNVIKHPVIKKRKDLKIEIKKAVKSFEQYLYKNVDKGLDVSFNFHSICLSKDKGGLDYYSYWTEDSFYSDTLLVNYTEKRTYEIKDELEIKAFGED